MPVGANEIADRAVGFCRHIPEMLRPHDWACAACIADAVRPTTNDLGELRLSYEQEKRIYDEACSEITRLRAEVEALRGALSRIMAHYSESDRCTLPGDYGPTIDDLAAARPALRSAPPGAP